MMSGEENKKTGYKSSQPKADPEYLISQSTFTSLTVLSGSGPNDSVIGLSKNSGKAAQQWQIENNVLLWNVNTSYCVIPQFSDRTLRLGDISTSSTEWIHDIDNCFVINGSTDCMDVPWEQPRTNVVVYPKHGGVNQQWWTKTQLDASLNGAPPAVYPVSATDQTTYLQEIARSLNNQLTPPTDPLPYERDVATFPGLVSSFTPRVTKIIVLDLLEFGQASDLRMTVPQDWQATDLYVVAEDVVEINLPDTLTPERASQIQVRVSAHVDFLQPDSANVVGQGNWLRMPVVTELFELVPGANQIRSQYGGHLIFVFSEGENFTTDVEVKNVVQAPFFRLGETSDAQWQVELNKETPHTLLESDKTVVVVATSDARNLTNPTILMSRYEEIITMLNYAAGFDDTEPPPRGKFWLVNDIQITAGSAHAGFPAMFDRTYYDMTDTNTPYDWVSWHELGHNYQQMTYWEGAYGSESTVNLYSLYIQEQLFNEDRLEQQGDYIRAADHVDAGMTFEQGDVWEQLVFLMEIKFAFPEQGWEMFRQLRKITRALSATDAETIASDKQRQIDHAYKNLSKIIGSDLINTYNRWSLPISQEAQDEILALGLPKAPGDLSHRPPRK